jgi:hypothetical protein
LESHNSKNRLTACSAIGGIGKAQSLRLINSSEKVFTPKAREDRTCHICHRDFRYPSNLRQHFLRKKPCKPIEAQSVVSHEIKIIDPSEPIEKIIAPSEPIEKIIAPSETIKKIITPSNCVKSEMVPIRLSMA